MIGVYTITNRIDGKRYVGCSINIEQRWASYRGTTRSRMGIVRAIRKHGISNFRFEIVERCSKKQLAWKEACWIAKLKPEYNGPQPRSRFRSDVALVKMSAGIHARLKKYVSKSGHIIQRVIDRAVLNWLQQDHKL